MLIETRKSASGTLLREAPVGRVGKPDRNAVGASRDIAQCLGLDQEQAVLNVVLRRGGRGADNRENLPVNRKAIEYIAKHTLA
ncbi:hypothetical protein [Bradyrhizobium sp. AUGA SZCCT0160]|jgi:hypothetical protein|uniref:hypothetical protein n=1 Tax=Bradyrhizobium sp. AUGA SZCCT0160 TaxID=2807662 RepID=UPI001BA73453|nr:hypothetical protein [Bradyrhizobium sp. AUGA SZCCT0160]MBR1193144.1 hypothetical protein [Bradyrhizobium sp. AUGA SZCCT0160]